MNKLTKKLSLIVTSVLLSASIAMTPVAAASSRGKKYTQGNSATTNPAAGTLEEVTDLAAADTSSLISENYLNESQSSTLTGEHYVIVSLEGKSLSDRTNGDVTEYLDSFAGSAAAAEIEAEQSAFLRRLSAANVPYEYKYAYNTVANAVAVKIDVRYLSDVKKISGVDEVTVSEYYYAPQDIDVSERDERLGNGYL